MNRETKARLRAIRDGLYEFAVEIDEMVPEKEKKEKEVKEKETLADTNVTFTAADKPPKEGIYMKDLNEYTDIKDMSIIGQITNIGDLTTFTRKTDGSDGQVRNYVLTDDSGDMLVVFWDEQVDMVKDFMLGDDVKITNAWQVKRNKKGILELHPGKYFNIERVE